MIDIRFVFASFFLLSTLQLSFSDVGHKSVGQRNFEIAVRFYDKDLTNVIADYLYQNSIAVRGFYHVSSSLSYWMQVLEEHIMIMDGKRFQSNLFSTKREKNKKKIARLSTGWSSLFEFAREVEIVFDGAPKHYKEIKDIANGEAMHLRAGLGKLKPKRHNISIENFYDRSYSNPTILSELKKLSVKEKQKLLEILGEVYTLNHLHSFCGLMTQKKKKTYVFYMHNQETNCTSDLHYLSSAELNNEPFVTDIVNSFILEFPSVCLTALASGYALCGTDFNDQTYENNIWWAQCDYISTLPYISPISTIENYLSAKKGKHPQKPFSPSLFPAKEDKNFKHAKYSLPEFQNKCIFNMKSGSRRTSLTHVLQGGEEVVRDDTCNRDEYRFNLVEVLSALHDDNSLLNRRNQAPSLMTELKPQLRMGESSITNKTDVPFFPCV